MPIIRTLIRMLEADRLRTAQIKVEAAHRQALQARKLLDTSILPPEKRADLTEIVASAKTLGADFSVPVVGPIFASSKGTALNMNNLLNRQILPVLNRCQPCHKVKDGHAKADHEYKRDESLPSWHGFHGFRRGLGTNLKRLGVDLKTIQEILRHAHIATTADIYVKEISEQAVEAMDRLERQVVGELKKGPKSEPAISYSAVNLQHGSWAVTPYAE